MKLHYFYFLIFMLHSCQPAAQHHRQGNFRIAFYNVENLFDTTNQAGIKDEDFTPDGRLRWNTERYLTKLDRISKVVKSMNFPDLLGLAEIENASVLQDLAKHPALEDQNYGIIHHDSPDERGIDVAILFRKEFMRMIDYCDIEVQLHPSIAENPRTRDILKARFAIKRDTFLVYVNHWPSRSGGLAATEPARLEAARILRDDLQRELRDQPDACAFVMGDFNDEPFNESIRDILKAGTRKELIRHRALLFNASLSADRNDRGSYNYRGKWNMLDQILLSSCLATGSDCYEFLHFDIFQEEWMMYRDNRFGFRPSRTYGGPNYYGGYSDHLPVYADFSLCGISH